jgi:hypothetical protein
MKYVKDMGLNTGRFEGNLGNEEIYDIADREGVILMPGFVCCSAWENDTWNAEQGQVAHASSFVWAYLKSVSDILSPARGHRSRAFDCPRDSHTGRDTHNQTSFCCIFRTKKMIVRVQIPPLRLSRAVGTLNNM